MDKELRDLILTIILFVVIFALVLMIIIKGENRYNDEIHSDDVNITEWISPDGVHYWYRSAGYQGMMAPRYDCYGELVIDE